MSEVQPSMLMRETLAVVGIPPVIGACRSTV